MDDLLVVLFAVVALIGTVGVYLQRDRFNKLIAVGIIYGGVVPFIVDRGYLDVAIAVSLIIPITTIIMLPLCRRQDHDA
ncbi:EhaD family protein [Methanoculleus sp.]|uniref:EhaD family protein n=1 Tax=Methanoculleus sp. TaxID=90427 RepID=UPI0025FDDBED|nr:EhaD family protein [Methanoculleus sp.]